METENNQAELFGTETMAELCARQGRLAEAIAIYQRLMQSRPEDERQGRWIARFQALARALGYAGAGPAAIEPPARQAAGQPPAGSERTPVPAPVPAPVPGAGPRAEPRGEPRPEAPPMTNGVRQAQVPAPLLHRLPLLITQPVRSGQVVRAEQNDIIVLASVTPGAQLVADGNIHVYGALRGQAIAGAMGCAEARIFCQKLDPELVAINGIYLISEDIPPGFLGGRAQVFLRNDRCLVDRL
jgi:septum site-determining protein MinC